MGVVQAKKAIVQDNITDKNRPALWNVSTIEKKGQEQAEGDKRKLWGHKDWGSSALSGVTMAAVWGG